MHSLRRIFVDGSCLHSGGLQDDAGIVAPEAEGIRQHGTDLGPRGFAHGRKPKAGILGAKSGVRGQQTVGQSNDGNDRLDGARRSERVSGQTLGGRQRWEGGTKDLMERLGLGRVVVDGARAVQVHVVNGGRFNAGVIQSTPHGLRGPGALGMGARGVVGVAAQSRSRHQRENWPLRWRGFE